MLFYFNPSVPPEILARGPRATEAYKRALLEGKGYSKTKIIYSRKLFQYGDMVGLRYY